MLPFSSGVKMLREYAQSLSNRGNFIDELEVNKVKHGKDKFMSLFCYDEDVLKYVKEKRKIAGYNGKIYLAKEHIIDVDGETYGEGRDSAADLVELLKELNVPHKIFFSGTGFHISIPQQAFKWEPHVDLHNYVKDALRNKGIFNFADVSVTDKTRLIRLNNTVNSKSGLYKINLDEILTLNEISISNISKADIKQYAAKAKDISTYGFPEEIEPIFDALPKKTKSIIKPTISKPKDDFGRHADPVNYPCIQDMLKWTGFGKRHQIALRLSAWFRWRYPEHIVNLIMEDWRKQVSTKEKPFAKKEMKSIVESAYSGHDGNGNNYGCNDPIRDSFCKQSCRLFGAKKDNNMIDFMQMAQQAVTFYQSGIKAIDIGELYDENFPIYPGELVIVQAPPKSMKTMLIHNWVASFQKPTYFLEMEMSPRQMYIRHVQIRGSKSYEEIENDLRNGDISYSEDSNWLTIDYKPCFPFELQKRIDLMRSKPEIIVIDHIGLMESNKYDMNAKMEEIMATLRDVAIKNNMIVFAVSEMTKESMNTRNGVPAIAASRGSARIGYTANKVLQIKAYREQGEISYLILDCVANREKESLYVHLEPENCRLIKSYKGIPNEEQ